MSETKIVRQATEDKPALMHVIDVAAGELHEPSGVFDDQTGRELTNSEVIDDFAKHVLGADQVIASSNGLSSPAVKEANAALAKNPNLSSAQKAAAFQVTKLAVMPKDK